MIRLAALLLPLFFALAAQATDEATCSNLLANHVTPEQLAALRAAHHGPGNYQVRAVRGTVNGRKRTVVFLGEFHSRTNEEKALGDAVIGAFPCIGYECANLRGYWGGRGLLLFFHGVEKLRSFALGKDAAAHSSTVMDIPRKAAVWLERDHKATVGENLAIWAMPAAIFAGMAGTAAFIVRNSQQELQASGNDWTPVFLFAGAATLVGVASVKFAKHVERWLRGSWMMRPLDYYLDYAVVHGRNRTIGGAIVNSFAEDDDLDTLLVIVGYNHVPGLITLLEQRAFELLTFE